MQKKHFFAGLGNSLSRALHLDNTTPTIQNGQLRGVGMDGYGNDDLRLLGNWEIEARVRITATSPEDYLAVFGRFAGSTAEWSLFYLCSTQRFAFDSFQYNATGGLIYRDIPAVAPLGSWHTVRFTHDGTTLRGYLNGALLLTEAVNFGFVNTSVDVLSIGSVAGAGQYRASMDLDYFQVITNGVRIVRVDFNEADGPAQNTGTLGGQATWADTNPRITL